MASDLPFEYSDSWSEVAKLLTGGKPEAVTEATRMLQDRDRSLEDFLRTAGGGGGRRQIPTSVLGNGFAPGAGQTYHQKLTNPFTSLGNSLFDGADIGATLMLVIGSITYFHEPVSTDALDMQFRISSNSDPIVPSSNVLHTQVPAGQAEEVTVTRVWTLFLPGSDGFWISAKNNSATQIQVSADLTMIPCDYYQAGFDGDYILS